MAGIRAQREERSDAAVFANARKHLDDCRRCRAPFTCTWRPRHADWQRPTRVATNRRGTRFGR
jgi:hypothetical protein